MLKSVALHVTKDVPLALDNTQVSSLKMLLFDKLPRRCRKQLDKSKVSCLRRDEKYGLFDDAIKKFEDEIDIVMMIRNQRWMMIAVKELMFEKGAALRREVHEKAK